MKIPNIKAALENESGYLTGLDLNQAELTMFVKNESYYTQKSVFAEFSLPKH